MNVDKDILSGKRLERALSKDQQKKLLDASQHLSKNTNALIERRVSAYQKYQDKKNVQKDARGRKANTTTNPMTDLLKNVEFLYDLPPKMRELFEVSAYACSSGNITSLSTTKLLDVMKWCDVLSTQTISERLFVGESQARRYVQAAKMVILFHHKYTEGL